MRLDDTGRVVGFLEKPKTDAELNDVRTDPALDRRPRHPQPRPRLAWPAWASTCSTATRWSTCSNKTDYQDFGKEIFPGVDPHAPRAGSPVRRLLGRHRHDPLVLRGEPACSPSPTRRSSSPRPTAPIYTRARFLPPTRCRRRHDRAEPDRRRLPDRGRHDDREQRHRPALPDRPQRDDPQLDADGGRLLRDPRRALRPIAPTAARRSASATGRIIEGAIVDKNCRIGAGTRSRPASASNSYGLVGPDCSVRDGILIVAKGGVVPEGWHV